VVDDSKLRLVWEHNQLEIRCMERGISTEYDFVGAGPITKS